MIPDLFKVTDDSVQQLSALAVNTLYNNQPDDLPN
jgi:hypothetical protein